MKFYISCFELSQYHPQTLLIVMHKIEEQIVHFFTKSTINLFPLDTYLPTMRFILVQHGVKDLCYMTKQYIFILLFSDNLPGGSPYPTLP